jgi:uncharacterized integral membrane protein
MQTQMPQPEVYQGQFGEFTITDGDRQGVWVYRAGLMAIALSFAAGVGLLIWSSQQPVLPAFVIPGLTILYGIFVLGLGVSLLTIHIYMVLLHRVLQLFWAVGAVAAIALVVTLHEPLPLVVIHYPASLLGIGFTFAALTGIFFKEAFCFNRAETKLLTPLVPIVLLGHLAGIIPAATNVMLLSLWAGLMLIFAVRKWRQATPDDIGDKSVFDYLHQQAVQR